MTADSISVVAIQPPLAPGDSPQGFQFNLGDPVDMLEVFAEMVNECGGINGRDIDLTVVEQEGDAADQATTLANAQAACIKATEDNEPFIVLSWAGGFAAPQCITDEHETLMMSGIATTNEFLDTAQGRHILLGNTNEVGQFQAPMLDLIDSGKLEGKKVAVLYPTFTTGQDLIKANVVDLLKSKDVNVVYSDPLTPDPAGDISSQYPLLVQQLKQDGVDVLVTGSAGGNTFRFSALTKELRNQGMEKDVTIFNLDARFDAVADLSRQVGGVDGAELINDMDIFAYAAAGQQDWRTGATEGDLVTLCNNEYAAHTTLPQGGSPSTRSARIRARPVRDRRRDLRDLPHTRARALQRGPRPHPGDRDQGVRGAPVHRQHRGPGVTCTPRRTDHQSPSDEGRVHARARQAGVPVRAPVTATGPRQLPDLPHPAAGLRRGRQGRERAVLRRLAALTPEEHRTGEVVARRELARGTVEADASLLDEDDAVRYGGGDVQ